MISFQGFKPSGIEKIANAMGFQGEEKDFQKFLEENPSAFKDARGVRFKKGGIKGKSKKPKVRGAGIAQRGVRPAKMY